MRFLVVISLFVFLTSFAQDDCPGKRRFKKELKIANAYLKINQPEDALIIFRRLFNCDSTNVDVISGYGISLLSRTDAYDESERLLKKALTRGNTEMSFYLASLYLKTYQFDEAMNMVEKYSVEGKEITYAEVENLRQTINRAKESYSSPSDYKIRLLGESINSKYSDYTPVITEDGSVMFFTSRRKEGLTSDTKLPEPGDENIYMSQSDHNQWQHAAKLASPVNSATHDATVALMNNGKEMIFYRTHENITGGNLLVSTFENEHWSEPSPFISTINTQFQESSAWVSSDGNMIFFASNRPGGYGGKDIYRLVKLPNGEWSKALNLGPSINSPLDEDGPIFHEDSKTLYFMSNGHSTIGGFDIFFSQWSESNRAWKSAVNMGYPVNSTNDDIYFVIDKSGISGYFSSDRAGGYGSQDIYSVTLPKEKGLQIIRSVITKNTQPVQAKISLIDEATRELVGIYNSNPINGAFVMLFKPGSRYKMIIEAEGIETETRYVESDSDEELQNMAFTLN